MTVEELNALAEIAAAAEFSKCCGATAWVNQMVQRRPFDSEAKIFEEAQKIWFSCTRHDWLEAFSHHPKIGDLGILEKKFAATKEWSDEEQQAVATARTETLEKLAKLNQKYEDRFGYIFIVCATGLTAVEMLQIVELRLRNNPYDEIKIAIGEQNRIIKLRLKKLLS